MKYKNKARCKNCGDVIESKYRHDFVTCSCFDANDPETHGFFLDGGNDYQRYGGNLDDIEFIKKELPPRKELTQEQRERIWQRIIRECMEYELENRNES